MKGVAGGKTRVLHRNLLLPQQGRARQQGGIKGEGISHTEDAEEGRDEMPKVARAPQGRPKRGTKPKASTTQQKEASRKDASADLESEGSDSRLLSKQKDHSLLAVSSSSEPMSGHEDSSEEDMHTDSLTSHTTASGSTTADLLTSTASSVEDVSPDMPYLEGSTQPDLKKDSVFTQQQLSDSVTHDTSTLSPPEPPVPRRSARNTKGAPPVHFGKVYTYSTIISKVAESPNFRQTLYGPCIIPKD